jgi:hypothetical protein
MSRILILLGLACRLVATGVAAQVSEKPANLLADPSFEGQLNEKGLPGDATTFAVPADAYQLAVTDGGRTGTKALSIQGNGEYAGVVVVRTELDRSLQYALRGWVKIEGNAKATATVKFDYFRGTNEWLGSTIPKVITPADSGWQIVALVDNAVAYPEATTIGAVAAVTGDGKAWFDDLEIVARRPLSIARNLLSNGSFELASSGRPNGYSLSQKPEDATVVFVTSDEKPRDGWYCLHLKGKVDYAVAVGDRIQVKPGKVYALNGHGRLQQGRACFKVDYYSGDQYLGSTESSPFTSGDWEEQRLVTEPTRFTSTTQICVCLVIEGNSDAYFDKLMLIEK